MDFRDAFSYTNSKRMHTRLTQYMVDFTLPPTLSDDFIGTIPQQRKAVNLLFLEGKLLNYALSLENSKLWAIFCANSEVELMEMISTLPLSHYMETRISELTFYNAAEPALPAFSVN